MFPLQKKFPGRRGDPPTIFWPTSSLPAPQLGWTWGRLTAQQWPAPQAIRLVSSPFCGALCNARRNAGVQKQSTQASRHPRHALRRHSPHGRSFCLQLVRTPTAQLFQSPRRTRTLHCNTSIRGMGTPRPRSSYRPALWRVPEGCPLWVGVF